MSAVHSVALARLRLASDGSAIGCSLLLLNRSIGFGWRPCSVRLPLAIAERKASESGALERTVGVIVKATDLLSRANAMVKASRPLGRAPIAKRPPAARKPAGGKKKPCRIA